MQSKFEIPKYCPKIPYGKQSKCCSGSRFDFELSALTESWHNHHDVQFLFNSNPVSNYLVTCIQHLTKDFCDRNSIISKFGLVSLLFHQWQVGFFFWKKSILKPKQCQDRRQPTSKPKSTMPIITRLSLSIFILWFRPFKIVGHVLYRFAQSFFRMQSRERHQTRKTRSR